MLMMTLAGVSWPTTGNRDTAGGLQSTHDPEPDFRLRLTLCIPEIRSQIFTQE